MKMFIGAGLVAAAIYAGTIGISSAASARQAGAETSHHHVSSDVSARRRIHHAHRRHRPRVYVRGPYRPYYQRPTYYVPQGPAPFFPFGFGYGLDPSW